jgi:hypothetical protein
MVTKLDGFTLKKNIFVTVRFIKRSSYQPFVICTGYRMVDRISDHCSVAKPDHFIIKNYD